MNNYINFYLQSNNEPTLDDSGHRIATMMFYVRTMSNRGNKYLMQYTYRYWKYYLSSLSIAYLKLEDTRKGGLTAFPQAGMAATPRKGSAVFWYNLKRNGEKDWSTHHCACPIVLGHKTSALLIITRHLSIMPTKFLKFQICIYFSF